MKQEIESLSREFRVSMNKTIQVLGVAKSTIYYKSKEYPDRKRKEQKQLGLSSKNTLISILDVKEIRVPPS